MNRVHAIALGIFTLLAVLAATLVPATPVPATPVLATSLLAQEAGVSAPERGLQTELEPRDADQDWRAEVGLTPREEPQDLPEILSWILANLVTIIIWTVALVIIALIVMVLINFGGSGGFRAGAEAQVGQRSEADGPDVGRVLDAPNLTLDEILGLEDLEAALGALLRMVLVAALSLSGRVLKRSATARESLRRLPSDFAHLSAIATLVREAERVRYGGASITRDRFEELVGLVRPVLSAEPRP